MSEAIVRGRGGAPHEGWLTLGGATWPCVLGAAGIRANKSEGDGATPAGTLPLRRLLFRADRVPPPAAAAGLPRAPLAPDDAWCDDPASPFYNRAVRRPFAGRTEALWREDALYDLVAVLGWNDAPAVRGRGSAIFLHAAPPGGGPTEGCIGLDPAHLTEALRAGLTTVTVLG